GGAGGCVAVFARAVFGGDAGGAGGRGGGVWRADPALAGSPCAGAGGREDHGALSGGHAVFAGGAGGVAGAAQEPAAGGTAVEPGHGVHPELRDVDLSGDVVAQDAAGDHGGHRLGGRGVHGDERGVHHGAGVGGHGDGVHAARAVDHPGVDPGGRAGGDDDHVFLRVF